MHIHIIGICGTFMGGIAALARADGHRVTGSDANVYPPMSSQLEALDIELINGYDPAQLDLKPDIVLVGNVMSRGNPLIERLLDSPLAFTSGPQWLAENMLRRKRSRAGSRPQIQNAFHLWDMICNFRKHGYSNGISGWHPRCQIGHGLVLCT